MDLITYGAAANYAKKLFASSSTNLIQESTYELTSDSNTVPIGIHEFNADSKYLMVFKNTVFIAKDQEYTIVGNNIQKISGTWDNGTVFNFISVQRTTDLTQLEHIMPDGGFVGETMSKNSGTNYDVGWDNRLNMLVSKGIATGGMFGYLEDTTQNFTPYSLNGKTIYIKSNGEMYERTIMGNDEIEIWFNYPIGDPGTAQHATATIDAGGEDGWVTIEAIGDLFGAAGNDWFVEIIRRNDDTATIYSELDEVNKTLFIVIDSDFEGGEMDFFATDVRDAVNDNPEVNSHFYIPEEYGEGQMFPTDEPISFVGGEDGNKIRAGDMYYIVQIDPGVVVRDDHIFVDINERSSYFETNPNELKYGMYVQVGAYFERYIDGTWYDVNAIIRGEKGLDGISVPAGGNAGQVLKKDSDTDYDFKWETEVGHQTYLDGTEIDNIINLDMSGTINFKVEIDGISGKTITFSNIPQNDNTILTITILLDCITALSVDFPESVMWQTDDSLVLVAGEKTFVILISYDKGVSWLGDWVSGWESGGVV